MALINTTIATPEAMAALCAVFYTDHLKNGSAILLLEGNLGAGKTTFCHGFNQALGITDTINSPTFNLLNDYQGARGRLYHYDLYRMRDPEEVVEAGFLELWESVYRGSPGDGGGAIHAVEWWQRAGEYMPVGTHTYRVRIAWEQGADKSVEKKADNKSDASEELRRVVIERMETLE